MRPERIGAALGGGGLVLACGALARLDNLTQSIGAFLLLWIAAGACYALGLRALWAARSRRALAWVLGAGLAGRLVLLPTLPTLSTDAYRYVWDARVSAAGVNPYAYPPSAPEVAALREGSIYPRLNHPSWRTIYPPGAQAFFRVVYALAPDSVAAMKAALALAELVALGLVLVLLRALGLPLARAAIYAWSPLVLVEVWSSAHLDALVLPLVLAATLAALRERPTLAGACLGVATLVKLYPALLVVVLARRPRALAVFAAVVAAGWAPLVPLGLDALGSLPRYLAEERFNPGLVRSLIDHPLPVLAAVALWTALVARRGEAPLPARLVVLAGGTVALGPNVFPWYALWLVPFLAAAPSVAWLGWTLALGLAYTFFLASPWAIPAWARLFQLVPLAAAIPEVATTLRRAPASEPRPRPHLTAL